MEIGNTYLVYNPKFEAESVVKVINIVKNNCYICTELNSDFPLILTEKTLEDCEVTLIYEDKYPTTVDNNDYRYNVSNQFVGVEEI